MTTTDRVAIGLDIVRVKARRLSRCRGVEQEELESAGHLAVAESLARTGTTALFIAYANKRIEGAMRDECRSVGLLSRDERRMARRVTHALHELRGALSREPTDEEIALRLETTVEAVQEAHLAMAREVERALDEVEAPSASPSLYRHELQRAMAKLPERYRTVIALRFFDELTCNEIARRFSVTESRACQLIQKSVSELRLALAVEESA